MPRSGRRDRVCSVQLQPEMQLESRSKPKSQEKAASDSRIEAKRFRNKKKKRRRQKVTVWIEEIRCALRDPAENRGVGGRR